MLQDPAIRQRLSVKCAELPDTTGGQEIADMLYQLATAPKGKKSSGLTYKRLLVQDRISRGSRHVIMLGLRRLALVYRFIHPHIKVQEIDQAPPIFGDQNTAAELHPLIKSSIRFEHLITGASAGYRKRREEIAYDAYGKETVVTKEK
jgi:hypothetical protein